MTQAEKPQEGESAADDQGTAAKPPDAAKTPPADLKSSTNSPDEKTNEGRLFVQTDPPGLEVFVDGKSVGVSPLTVRLPVGDHTYKVAPPLGKTPIERKVQIKASTAARIKVEY